MANPPVFPLPVCAQAIKSRFAARIGKLCVWIGVGLLHLHFSIFSRSFGSRFISLNAFMAFGGSVPDTLTGISKYRSNSMPLFTGVPLVQGCWDTDSCNIPARIPAQSQHPSEIPAKSQQLYDFLKTKVQNQIFFSNFCQNVRTSCFLTIFCCFKFLVFKKMGLKKFKIFQFFKISIKKVEKWHFFGPN